MSNTEDASCSTVSKQSAVECVEDDESGYRSVSVLSTTYAALNTVSASLEQLGKKGIKPSLVYTATDILLRQHQKYSRRPGHLINLKDLFKVEGINHDVADIFIISGDAGMGKTMLLKYMLEKWGHDSDAIDELEDRNLLFFEDLQQDKYNNFNEFASNLMQTVSRKLGLGAAFKDLLLTMPILVALDGFDGSGENSRQLVKEVLTMNGADLKIIITCRPQYVDTLYKQIPKQKRKYVTHLDFPGIPVSYHEEFVCRLLDSRSAFFGTDGNQYAFEKIKEGLVNRLPYIQKALGDDLCNPLMLRILTGMWNEHPVIELDKRTQQLFIMD